MVVLRPAGVSLRLRPRRDRVRLDPGRRIFFGQDVRDTQSSYGLIGSRRLIDLVRRLILAAPFSLSLSKKMG